MKKLMNFHNFLLPSQNFFSGQKTTKSKNHEKQERNMIFSMIFCPGLKNGTKQNAMYKGFFLQKSTCSEQMEKSCSELKIMIFS